MAAKRAAQRQEVIPPEATLPGVLIPPSEAADNQKSAYWIELLDNPEELRKALGTTEFFPLLREFPASLWGDRLSIYVYRLPDEDGMMVKNEAGARKYIKPIIRTPIDEDWIASKHGGGKYLLYLKLDNKASIKETTVRIDGPPKVAAGQTVEIDGRPVTVGSAQPASHAAEDKSDVAAVIEASASANRQNMEILAEGSKAAIQLVRDQATQAGKPDAASGIMDKLFTAMIDRIMNPPAVADPVDTFVKLQTLISKQNPEPEPEKEGAAEAAITLVERITGKSVADMMKPRTSAAAEDSYGWVAPVVGAAQHLIGQIPEIMREARLSRDMDFRRQVWLRSAPPGSAPNFFPTIQRPRMNAECSPPSPNPEPRRIQTNSPRTSWRPSAAASTPTRTWGRKLRPRSHSSTADRLKRWAWRSISRTKRP